MKPKFIKNVSDATAFPLKINHRVAGAGKIDQTPRGKPFIGIRKANHMDNQTAIYRDVNGGCFD